jgi:hypothetical protein
MPITMITPNTDDFVESYDPSEDKQPEEDPSFAPAYACHGTEVLPSNNKLHAHVRVSHSDQDNTTIATSDPVAYHTGPTSAPRAIESKPHEKAARLQFQRIALCHGQWFTRPEV